MATLIALNLPTSSINYGTLIASSTTGTTNQLLNIENAGNASTTIQTSGVALANGANTLATSSQHDATSSVTCGGGETALSSAATTITGINIAPVFDFPIGGRGWTNATSVPVADSELGAAAYNNYLYAIGGVGAGTSTYFARINATGSLGAWSSTRALPHTINENAAVTYNGYMYSIGGKADGNNPTTTVNFAIINSTGSLGTWTSTQAMPFATELQGSVAYNGYLYVIGGVTGATDTSTVIYAPINSTGSLGTWTSTQALPYALDSHAAVAYNGYLYAIGGVVSGTTMTASTTFAPINATGSLGAWTSTQPMPFKAAYHAGVVYNGYMYAIGGASTGSSSSQTSTINYAPINSTGSLGAWTSTQAFPNQVENHASVIYNGYLYTIGGYVNGGGSSTSTVRFTPLNARSTYWGLTVPNSAVGGDYTGTNTFTAVFSL